jgi:hypothetical protein
MGISPELLLTILGLLNIEIESVSLNSAGELEIRVKSIAEGAVCHKCGRRINKPIIPVRKSDCGIYLSAAIRPTS